MPDRIATDAAADELVAAYEQADQTLRHMVRAALGRGAPGTAAYFARQQRAVAHIVAELRARTPALAAATVAGAYYPAAQATSASLGVEHGFSGVDREAVRVGTLALAGRLDGAAVTVGRSADDVFRRVGLGEVVQGLARGDSQRGVSSRIKARLADEGTTAFVDRANRRWRLEVYARMVARTTSREAVTAGVVNRMEALGEDLVQWSKHVNPCPICAPFGGNTYSLSGQDRRYPRATLLPPGHPNCRHVLTPARVAYDDFLEELGLAPQGPPLAVAV